MSWNRYAIPLALLAVAAAGVGMVTSPPEVDAISRTACYVALADDITPLLDARIPDAVAASPECAAGTNVTVAPNGNVNIGPSAAASDDPATRPPDVPTTRPAGERVNRSGDTPRQSSTTAVRDACRDDANVVGNLITQCNP